MIFSLKYIYDAPYPIPIFQTLANNKPIYRNEQRKPSYIQKREIIRNK